MMRDRVPEVVKEEVKARLAPRLEHEILRMLPRVPNPV
jgi:hypothetical protein